MNNPTDKVMTLGQRLVALSDTLVRSDGEPLDLTDRTVRLRLVHQPVGPGDDAPPGALVLEEPAVVDEPETAGNVTYPWTEDDVEAVRTLLGETDRQVRCWYWWLVSDGTKTDRHPGDGLKAGLTFVRDW